MRILHTSDWHLGRHFGPAPLIEYQREFLDWIVEKLKGGEPKPDDAVELAVCNAFEAEILVAKLRDELQKKISSYEGLFAKVQ